MKKRFFAVAGLIILTLSVAIFAASCGGGEAGYGVDSITTIDPANGATGVPVTRAITIVFNKDLDETTVTQTCATLTRLNGVITVTGAITYDAATRTLTFTPTFPLSAGALYTFTLMNTIRTKAATPANYTTTFTTQPAPILFSSSEDPANPGAAIVDPNIWSINADGSGKTALTTDATVHSISPVWSPDYTRIVYRRNAAGGGAPGNLAIVNADGSGNVALTSGTGNYIAILASWLPDASKIIFVYSNNIGVDPVTLASVNPDGTGFANLATPPAGQNVLAFYDISPDGSRITYPMGVTPAGPVDVHIVNADGTSDTKLTDVGAGNMTLYPYFSPDGNRIFYTMMATATNVSGIYAIDTDGTDPQTIVAPGAGVNYYLLGVSPDGTRIAYVATNAVTNLYLANIDGSSSVKVTNAAGLNEAGDVGFWSPDGSHFAYLFGDDSAGPEDVWVVNSDGTGAVNVTNYAVGSTADDPFDFMNISQPWSVEGTQLIFTRDDGVTSNIDLANADGSSLTRLTSSAVFSSVFGDWW